MDSNFLLNNVGLPDNNLFLAQGPAQQAGYTVDVKINGTSIASIAGPTPFMNISRSYENSDGYLSAIVESITLNGKIAPKTTGTGFSGIMSKISGLQNLLNCAMSEVTVFCDSTLTYQATGLLVKQFSADKTDNNWTKTADYTIQLERRINSSGNLKTVEDKAESWTIEPIEDAGFLDLIGLGINGNPEYNNPNLKPTAATPGAGQTANTINIKTIGQYRVTRRLSARGLPSPSGTGCTSNNQEEINKSKLKNARDWVLEQANNFASGTSGVVSIPGLSVGGNISTGIRLYNHVRGISADVYNGTFEMTDNWIAMPTGTHHTESFTIDCSTSNNFTKTVRVAGTVNGMAMHNISNSSPLLGSGTNNRLHVELPAASGYTTMSGSLTRAVPSVAGGNAGNGGSNSSSATTLYNNKYQNARDAWEYEIKPYMYRRACLGLFKHGAITRPAVNEINPDQPSNPAFTRDRPLNTIPVNTSEAHDPYKGVISYNYEFNNQYRAISGVISENINITHDAPADNISEVTVLGRYLGPIIQSIGRTNARKTITIDIVIPPPLDIRGSIPDSTVCPVGLGTDLRQRIQDIVDGNAPFYARDASIFGTSPKNAARPGTVFVQSDQETWNPTEGRFSKTVSWVYQQCNANTHWLNY